MLYGKHSFFFAIKYFKRNGNAFFKVYEFSIFFFLFFQGNGIIDENEFLQWVGKIQSLRDESSTKSSSNHPIDENDDITQDLIAAFR